MRIPPTSPTNLAERHVQLSEFVDVSVHSMTDTQMSTIVEPSVHAQRLERMMRVAEIPVGQAAQRTELPQCNRVCKRACDTTSLVCGALALPAFALVVLGPIWLVAPAGLLVASAVCYLMRGAPTPEMEQEYEMRRVSAQANDCRGV